MQSFSLDQFPEALRGAAVVFGNFDGVHKGHVWVLQVARSYGKPVVVLTFEPHTRTVLSPRTAPFRLTPGAAKTEALSKAGADAVVTLPFDDALALRPAAAFVETVLVDALAASIVVIGHNYRFGGAEEGDAKLLADIGEARGFRLITASPARNGWGERYASARIRDHILAGDLGEAQRLLGRPWSVSGIATAQRDGRLTLALGEHLRPAPGRYAVTLRKEDVRPAPGLAVLRAGEDHLWIQGAETEGPLRVFLHQRLGAAETGPSPADGVAASASIPHAAE